ncbi:beta-lactoglobulin [Lepus europaeus]|uniref:beta-lactoglobulin n=1 Tax=Lepus europaeus TaxID=9983 RepID=UPI002B4918DA|nr:beta-lactoglobulin [Lepus europaeus]XP_062062832.1 beta-lactoglobulin [Lepus europaeus]
MQLLPLSLFLSLAWALQDQSQVPVQPGFRPEQVEGHWHTIKLAATNRTAIEEGGSYRCYMSSIRLLENGDLKVTYFHRQDGRCVEDFYIAEKTDSPGRYTFQYKGKNYLTFVATSDDFVIMDWRTSVTAASSSWPNSTVGRPGQGGGAGGIQEVHEEQGPQPGHRGPLCGPIPMQLL